MFDKNNVCCYVCGENKGCIMCCYGGIPEHVKFENCGEDVCEWYSKLKTYTIMVKSENTTKCKMILNEEQLNIVVSVFKELDKNRLDDFSPLYKIQDEEENIIYESKKGL